MPCPLLTKLILLLGFFYFSGFQALFDQLKDKKLRILVGFEVDPLLVSEMTQFAKEGNVDLLALTVEKNNYFSHSLRLNYIGSFVGFMNDSDIFGNDRASEIFDLYIEK